MTTRLLSRFSRALFALWFVAMVGDTGALHACAMHGGAGHLHGAATASATPAHSSHHAAHSGSSATTHDASQPRHAPACTCLGECCTATVAVPALGAPEVNVATVVAVPDHPLDLPARVAPATASLRLPFANGPPAA